MPGYTGCPPTPTAPIPMGEYVEYAIVGAPNPGTPCMWLGGFTIRALPTVDSGGEEPDRFSRSSKRRVTWSVKNSKEIPDGGPLLLA